MPYAPLLPNFHLQAAANLHMAAMAALAASSQQQRSAEHFRNNSREISENSAEVPFLEVPREEGVTSSQQQLSPTARSDISSCSSGSSFNSLHGEFPNSNSSWRENSNFKMCLDRPLFPPHHVNFKLMPALAAAAK